MLTSIKDFFDSRGVGYTPNSKSWILACPKCNKRGKLYVRKNDGRFVCWVCKDSLGFSGKPEWLIAEMAQCSLAEARQIVWGDGVAPTSIFLNIEIHDFFGEDDEIPIFVPEALPTVEPHPDFRDLDSQWGARGAEYLEGRGVPIQVALQYGIKYWPERKSVVFPVINDGRLLGWQTRYIEKTEFVDEETGRLVKIPKARTSTGLRKEQTFMFADRLCGDHAVLCEGPIDALKCHLVGGNICSLGKGVSQQQLEIIKHSGISKLYLALDPDAYVESAVVLKELSQYMAVYDMRPPEPYKDIGEMAMEDVLALKVRAPRLNPNHIFLYIKDHYAL